MPDMARLSLEKRNAPDSSRQPRQIETDGDMVFSTADTSVQDTGRGGDP